MLLSRYLSLPGIYIFFAALRYARMRKAVPVSFISYMQDFFPIRENVVQQYLTALQFRNDFLVADIALCLLVTRAQGRLKQQTHLFIEGATVCVAWNVCWSRARAHPCADSLFLSSSSLVSRTTGKKERENNCIAKRKTQCIPTVTSKKEQQRASA